MLRGAAGIRPASPEDLLTATAPQYPTGPGAGPAPQPYTAPQPYAAASVASSPGAAPVPPAEKTPWYRRAWVLAVSAVLIAALSFASGFVAGNATAFFNRLGGPGMSVNGPGFPDGVRPGDGRIPQFPGGDLDDDGS